MNQVEKPELAYIGLGGNVGDVLGSFKSALQMLDASSLNKVVRCSEVYKTPPWGETDQDWFFNMCSAIETKFSAHEFLKFVLEIETQLKRTRTKRWGPRTIDIDVLVFGNQAIKTKELTVPHPRMQERLFVLQPLSEIAPDLMIRDQSIHKHIKLLDEPDLEVVETSLNWQGSS